MVRAAVIVSLIVGCQLLFVDWASLPSVTHRTSATMHSTAAASYEPVAKPYPVIIIMMDGFGVEYYRNSDMPTLNKMEKEGIFKAVPSLMPSVTNVNNAAICTGELPEKSGITGNSFFNTTSRQEEFMEEDSLVLAPTIFERAAKKGIKSKLFSSKKKSVGLLHRGTTEAVSPETASEEWKRRVGTPPPVYSREVNYWLFEAALYSIKNDKDIGLFYIHPTDYPMHTWPATSAESKEHLKRIDSYIAKLLLAAPNAIILITADHTVKHKSVCVDLAKACAARQEPIRMAISCEKDKYFKHHRGFGGSSYVYLNEVKDTIAVMKLMRSIPGVEEVYTRSAAARLFHLMPDRIGDLMVLGDSSTVFGDLETESEQLPGTYRTHGSRYEAKVPLFVYPSAIAPPADYFSANYKLAGWLFR